MLVSYRQAVNSKQLHRAAVRTLRAAVRREYPQGETREHLLAVIEVLAERSLLLHPVNTAHRIDPAVEAAGVVNRAATG
jgi:hypothetical protein